MSGWRRTYNSLIIDRFSNVIWYMISHLSSNSHTHPTFFVEISFLQNSKDVHVYNNGSKDDMLKSFHLLKQLTAGLAYIPIPSLSHRCYKQVILKHPQVWAYDNQIPSHPILKLSIKTSKIISYFFALDDLNFKWECMYITICWILTRQ